MNQVAVKLNTPEIRLVSNNRPSKTPSKFLNFDIPSKQILVLGAILIVLQFLDGLLTAIGVGHFGTDKEGNILIRTLMNSIGHVPALLLVKLTAVFVIVNLCLLASRVSWLAGALKAMITIYLCAAVIPWTAILFAELI